MCPYWWVFPRHPQVDKACCGKVFISMKSSITWRLKSLFGNRRKTIVRWLSFSRKFSISTFRHNWVSWVSCHENDGSFHLISLLSSLRSNSASSLLAGMDATKDPCEDFFQYACGTWNKKHVIPEDRSSISTFEVSSIDLRHLAIQRLIICERIKFHLKPVKPNCVLWKRRNFRLSSTWHKTFQCNKQDVFRRRGKQEKRCLCNVLIYL